MRGWVYIITNKSMPGLVKIGYSTKDPKLRAEELNHTGSPHPYTAVYDALVMHPYQIEQQVHKLLIDKKEGKEWFRCSISEAISAIKITSNNSLILERDEAEHCDSIQNEVNNDSPNQIDHLQNFIDRIKSTGPYKQRYIYCPYCNDKNAVPPNGTIILTCPSCKKQSSHDKEAEGSNLNTR